MAIIKIALGVAAVYSAVMWLWLCVRSFINRAQTTWEAQDAIERYTFHLGLCFILAAGFLGLIWG